MAATWGPVGRIKEQGNTRLASLDRFGVFLSKSNDGSYTIDVRESFPKKRLRSIYQKMLFLAIERHAKHLFSHFSPPLPSAVV